MAHPASTCLLDGAEPVPADPEILQAYLQCERDHANGGVQWRFGVRNARGLLYRRGVFTSFESAMAFADRMEDFGFVLEPESRAATEAGLHVVYAPGPERRGPALRAGPGAEHVRHGEAQFA